MNDLYQEILVKKKASAKDTALKILVIAVTVLMLAAGVLLFTPLLLVGAILCFVDFYFLLPQFDLEYEYLYVNGDIDVDRIKNRERRKRIGSYELANMEIIAPTGSHDLDSYLNNKNAKVIDYTSGEENAKSYTAVYNGEGKMEIVKLEITREIVEDMRRRSPRKVSRDVMLLG
jgi:hypothetical protein